MGTLCISGLVGSIGCSFLDSSSFSCVSNDIANMEGELCSPCSVALEQVCIFKTSVRTELIVYFFHLYPPFYHLTSGKNYGCGRYRYHKV